MYEPFAKNSITERIQFTGIVNEHAEVGGAWKSVAVQTVALPPTLPETSSAQPDPEGRFTRPKLHAIR